MTCESRQLLAVGLISIFGLCIPNYTSGSVSAINQSQEKLETAQTTQNPLLSTAGNQTQVKFDRNFIVRNGTPIRLVYVFGHSQPHSELCPALGTELKVFIFIASAPTKFESRQAIRLTWGHYSKRTDVKIAFMLGTTNDSNLNKMITDEDAIYGDIVRGQFGDSYNNLTLKTVSILEWIYTYCPYVKFVLKTDDDMFINVDNLLEFISTNTNETRTIFGRLVENAPPVRKVDSKYYLSQQEYVQEVFPVYTAGPAYLMTRDCVRELYVNALDVDYIKIEDVVITGIVADKLNIKRKSDPVFFYQTFKQPCTVRKLISVHRVNVREQFDMWKIVLGNETKC